MVEYYQTSNQGVVPVASHFNISPSQVYNWCRIFRNEGAAGLIPKRKGRHRTMKKPDKKAKLPVNEKNKYQEEIIKLRSELYHTQMENDVLKKLIAVSKNDPHHKKQK